MTNQQELDEAEKNLNQIQTFAIPQRKLGFGVTRQTQQAVIQRNQEIEQFKADQQRKIDQGRQQLKEQQAYEAQLAAVQEQRGQYEYGRKLALTGKGAFGLKGAERLGYINAKEKLELSKPDSPYSKFLQEEARLIGEIKGKQETITITEFSPDIIYSNPVKDTVPTRLQSIDLKLKQAIYPSLTNQRIIAISKDIGRVAPAILSSFPLTAPIATVPLAFEPIRAKVRTGATVVAAANLQDIREKPLKNIGLVVAGSVVGGVTSVGALVAPTATRIAGLAGAGLLAYDVYKTAGEIKEKETVVEKIAVGSIAAKDLALFGGGAAVGSAATKEAIAFTFEPVKVTVMTPQVQRSYRELIEQSNTGTKGSFELGITRGPAKALVQSRVDLLKEATLKKVVFADKVSLEKEALAFEKGLLAKKISSEGLLIQTDKGFKELIKSTELAIADGRITGPAFIVRTKEAVRRSPLLIDSLKGFTKSVKLSDTQVLKLAEAKTGLPTADPLIARAVLGRDAEVAEGLIGTKRFARIPSKPQRIRRIEKIMNEDTLGNKIINDIVSTERSLGTVFIKGKKTQVGDLTFTSKEIKLPNQPDDYTLLQGALTSKPLKVGVIQDGLSRAVVTKQTRGKPVTATGMTVIRDIKEKPQSIFDILETKVDNEIGKTAARQILKTQQAEMAVKILAQTKASALQSFPQPRAPSASKILSKTQATFAEALTSPVGIQKGTSLGSLPLTRSRQVPAQRSIESTRQPVVQQTRTFTNEQTVSRDLQIPREVTREISREIPREISKEITREITIPREISRELTRMIPRQLTRQIPRQIPRPSPRFLPFPKTSSTREKLRGRFKDKGGEDIFGLGKATVSVRRRGKFKSIGSSLTFEQAIKRGLANTRGTLARTFKISGLGSSDLRSVSLPSEYRLPKGKTRLTDPFTFIQRSKFSLSSFGEKREIRLSRQKTFKGAELR